jgi:hypothetical protein
MSEAIASCIVYTINFMLGLIESLKTFSNLVKKRTYFFSYPAEPIKLNISFLEVYFMYSFTAEMSIKVAVGPLIPMV